MNMKNLNAALVLITAVASAQAFAGDKTGNGGGAWVCRDGIGQITSAELFELHGKDLAIRRSDAPVYGQIEFALAILEQRSAERVPAIKRFLNQIMFGPHRHVEANRAIAPIGDSGVETIERDGPCTLEYAIKVEDRPGSNPPFDVLVDDKIINAMPNTDQAALWTHEAVAKYNRATFTAGGPGLRNTSSAQHVVAQLYSLIPFAGVPSPRDGIPAHGGYVCKSQGYGTPASEFYAFTAPNGTDARIQFARFGGVELIAPITSDFGPSDRAHSLIMSGFDIPQFIRKDLSNPKWPHVQDELGHFFLGSWVMTQYDAIGEFRLATVVRYPTNRHGVTTGALPKTGKLWATYQIPAELQIPGITAPANCTSSGVPQLYCDDVIECSARR